MRIDASLADCWGDGHFGNALVSISTPFLRPNNHPSSCWTEKVRSVVYHMAKLYLASPPKCLRAWSTNVTKAGETVVSKPSAALHFQGRKLKKYGHKTWRNKNEMLQSSVGIWYQW